MLEVRPITLGRLIDRLPVIIYDNACAGSQAYILLASEFIRRRRTAVDAANQATSEVAGTS